VKYFIWAISLVCAMGIMVLVWTDQLVVAGVAFMASMVLLVGLRVLEHQQKQQSQRAISAATTGDKTREA
jgi:hypothetical protein